MCNVARNWKKSRKPNIFETFWEVRAGFEPAITVLQTGALPLGYRTILNQSDSNGNRTRVTAVKGRCLNRLTMEPYLPFLRPVNKTNSPSRARTYNNSVNSRVLYHWAIEDHFLLMKVCAFKTEHCTKHMLHCLYDVSIRASARSASKSYQQASFLLG